MSFWDENPASAIAGAVGPGAPMQAGGIPFRSMGGGVTSLPGVAAGPGVSTGGFVPDDPRTALQNTTANGVAQAAAVGQQAATPGGTAVAGNYGNLSDPSAWMKLVQQGPQAVGDWLAQSNPQLAQLFQSNPGLKDYYAQQIIKSPGANPTEQAGSAQYWTNKALQDPGITGHQGSSGGSVGGNHGIPGLDPGYDFQVGEATKAIQRSAASKGTLLTGGTLKGLADYVGNDMASSAYQGAFNRSYSLASLGENAAAGQGANNSGYANSASNALTNNANAQGASSIAAGNAVTSGINNAVTGYTLNNLFKPKLSAYGGGGFGDVGPVQ